MPSKSQALAAVAAMTCLLVAANAQAQRLAGAWRAHSAGTTINLTVQPDWAYVESRRVGSATIQQSGEIHEAGQDTIVFDVEDWQPKATPVYHLDAPSHSPDFTMEPVDKPAGGAWQIRFDGPDSFTLTDAGKRHSVTFKRAG